MHSKNYSFINYIFYAMRIKNSLILNNKAISLELYKKRNTDFI